MLIAFFVSFCFDTKISSYISNYLYNLFNLVAYSYGFTLPLDENPYDSVDIKVLKKTHDSMKRKDISA